jgi:HlyD family secretion protein
VNAGETVEAGALLFRLDTRQAEAALAAAGAQRAGARARLAAAEARLDNAQTGRREEELAITERALQRARSDLELAQQNYDRTDQLFTQGAVPRARLDQDQATLMAAQAQTEQLEAELEVGRLPARPAELDAARAEIEAAKAEIEAAQAEVERLEVALSERTGIAPVAGTVDEVYFATGEQVGQSTPVVSLLPDGAVEIRFFIGETERAALAPGDRVEIDCRGCTPVGAEVFWIASDTQFNPPIIYSRAEREDLVFLVKARPVGGAGLAPGQPVEVRPSP